MRAFDMEGLGMALVLAILSALCFGMALVTGRIGLRTLDARSGAAISIPTATLLFVAAAPFALDLSGFDARAALLFAVVGLFFPAIVTLLTFRSNELLGPTVTGAVSGTAPLFAVVGAAIVLGERVPDEAALSTAGVVAGIALLSSKKGVRLRNAFAWPLLWPIAGAAVRGLAQVAAKAGLVMWASPFAASLIGYVVSSATVVGADRILGSAKPVLTKSAIAWFALTGVLNGGAVLLMYAALAGAPVWMVAPVVASYPLVTAVVSAAVLRDERLTARIVGGALLTAGAVTYLVGASAL